MPVVNFVGASYRERSANLDAQVCINMYPVTGESGSAKVVKALYGTPGRRPLVSAVEVVVRGLHKPTDGSAAIVVIGNRVYRLTDAFALSPVGTIDNQTTPARIKDNGTTALIVTGGYGYTLNLSSNSLVQVVDPAFYGSDDVYFLNTYGILVKPGTNLFYITGADTITFDALDFASAESNFEPIVAFIVSHGDIIFFKQTVTEIWRATADTNFPFARDTNASIEHGCAAKYSVAKLDNTVFWLGENEEGGGTVWRLNGYTPQRMSTDAIEFAISGYPTLADATAYSYQQEGHLFYVITFPSGNATWVYDVASQLWHQRAYLDPVTGKLGRDRSNCHIYYKGKHIVGDYNNGNLRTLDLDYYMDGTDPMPAIRTGSVVSKAEYNRVAHNALQIDIEPGVGLNDGQGSSPVAMLDWSDDAGKTWSSRHFASMGKQGEYKKRLIWRRLGQSRARIYRLTISDPVKRVILGAALNPNK